MRHPHWLLGVILSSLLRSATAQQYAQRHSVPVEALPFDDFYDEYFTDSYDFDNNEDVYRWNVVDYPHPMKNFRFCNRLKPSHVCDPDNILEKQQADKLDLYIQQLYQETPCICEQCQPSKPEGIALGVALLKNMFQPYNEHPSRIIRSFTETLRSNWTLGSCDNDILIVVATTDRLSYTDVGKATSAYVSLHDAHRIFLQHKAYLSDGNFFEGLRAMIGDYYNRTRNIRLPEKEEMNLGLISGSIIGAVVILGVILCIILVLYKKFQKSLKEKADPEKDAERMGLKSEGVSSSWTKKDIKVMRGTTMTNNKYEKTSPSTKYEPCGTDEKDHAIPGIDEEIIDTTLALPSNPNDTQSTMVSSLDNSIRGPISAQTTSAESSTSPDTQPEVPGQTTSGSDSANPGSSSMSRNGANPSTSASNSFSPGSSRGKSDSDASHQTSDKSNGDVRNSASDGKTYSSPSTAEVLDEELAEAVEEITHTFGTFQPRPTYKGHQTSL